MCQVCLEHVIQMTRAAPISSDNVTLTRVSDGFAFFREVVGRPGAWVDR